MNTTENKNTVYTSSIFLLGFVFGLVPQFYYGNEPWFYAAAFLAIAVSVLSQPKT